MNGSMKRRDDIGKELLKVSILATLYAFFMPWMSNSIIFRKIQREIRNFYRNLS